MWETIIPAAVSAFGQFMQSSGANDANRANQEMSSAQMAFQERMSNTSYQRAVKDMEAAGLNPMLAYSQGGASSPGGSQAVMQNKFQGMASTAMEGQRLQQDLRNLREQESNIRADTDKKEAEAGLARSESMLNTQQRPGVLSSQHNLNAAGVSHIESQIQQLGLQGGLTDAQRTLAIQHAVESLAQTGLIDAHTGVVKIDKVLKELEIPHARNMSRAEDSWWKKKVTPYIGDMGRSTSSAFPAAVGGYFARGLRGAPK